MILLPLINYNNYDWKLYYLFDSLDPQEMYMH